jgi:hypothetical protein
MQPQHACTHINLILVPKRTFSAGFRISPTPAPPFHRTQQHKTHGNPHAGIGAIRLKRSTFATATTWPTPGWAAAAQGEKNEGPAAIKGMPIDREQDAAVAARGACTSTIRAASRSASASTVSASHVQELPEDRELCQEPRPSSLPAKTLTWPADLPEEPREEADMESCDDMVDIGMLSLRRLGRVGRGELHGEPMARER